MLEIDISMPVLSSQAGTSDMSEYCQLQHGYNNTSASGWRIHWAALIIFILQSKFHRLNLIEHGIFP